MHSTACDLSINDYLWSSEFLASNNNDKWNSMGCEPCNAGNADIEFCFFAQEAVVALEEVKRRSSAETAL